MWDTIVLGQVPGTEKFVSFTIFLVLALALALAVLARSIARRRSAWYWRIYAELQLSGVEKQLFPDATSFGSEFENPFVRASLHRYTKAKKATVRQELAGYSRRTVAALRAGTDFRLPG